MTKEELRKKILKIILKAKDWKELALEEKKKKVPKPF